MSVQKYNGKKYIYSAYKNSNNEYYQIFFQDNFISLSFAENIKLEHQEALLDSLKFKQFISNIDIKNIEITSIRVLNIFMFGKNLGFALLHLIATQRRNNAKLPGVVFLRGDAVCTFFVVQDSKSKKKYLVVTDQIRVPIGKNMLELTAGMLDERTNSINVACEELKEEIGENVTSNDLTPLCSFYPSAGGCDEKLHVNYIEKIVSTEIIEKLRDSERGTTINDKMRIITRVVELDPDSILKMEDSKANSAYLSYLYNKKRILPFGDIIATLPNGDRITLPEGTIFEKK